MLSCSLLVNMITLIMFRNISIIFKDKTLAKEGGNALYMNADMMRIIPATNPSNYCHQLAPLQQLFLPSSPQMPPPSKQSNN